jgi:hypothetical protein
MLGIEQISLKRCNILNNNISGGIKTVLELRYMEHIVHTCQGWQQLQLVSHSSKLLENQK